MVVHRRVPTVAALVATLAVAGAAHAQPTPRVTGSSVSIEAKKFEARVLVANDPGGKVTKVVFNLTPRCAADAASAKFATVPDVVASTSTVQGEHRVFAASIPDPSAGTFGAWTVRSTAFDAAGTMIGRHQTVVVRTFHPKFRRLAFEPATLDTSAGAASARLVVDLDHDAAITSLGIITSAHDNPTLGFTQLPGELGTDKAAGATPGLTSRIEQKAPGSLIGHFGFPAGTPALTLAVKRIFMADSRCRTAELAPPSPLSLAVASKSPRAMPVDVRVDKAALARGQLVVAFRLLGPAPRTAPAPEIGGQKAPVVTVNLLDGATPARVLGSTAARPVPSAKPSDKAWDGESMAIAPISIPSGPSALGEALKKGLQIEIDDGGRPLAPRVVVRSP